MDKKEIPLLRAEEIECRVGTVGEKGLSLLLYADARVPQKILDQVYTPFGWKRSHQSIDGNLYCTVEIYDAEKGEWIAKQDVGVTSYSEKASDSFKRACVNWGIGRELYSAPFIWIPAGKVNIQKKGDKYVSYDRFSVQYISYGEQREITALVIVNEGGQVVYEMKSKKTGGQVEMPPERLTEQQRKHLEEELQRTGVDVGTVLKRYKIAALDEMTPEIYERAIGGLKKSKSKIAA